MLKIIPSLYGLRGGSDAARWSGDGVRADVIEVFHAALEPWSHRIGARVDLVGAGVQTFSVPSTSKPPCESRCGEIVDWAARGAFCSQQAVKIDLATFALLTICPRHRSLATCLQ